MHGMTRVKELFFLEGLNSFNQMYEKVQKFNQFSYGANSMHLHLFRTIYKLQYNYKIGVEITHIL